MNMQFQIHLVQFKASKFIICFYIRANKDHIWMLRKSEDKKDISSIHPTDWNIFFFPILSDSCFWSCIKFYGSNRVSLLEKMNFSLKKVVLQSSQFG